MADKCPGSSKKSSQSRKKKKNKSSKKKSLGTNVSTKSENKLNLSRESKYNSVTEPDNYVNDNYEDNLYVVGNNMKDKDFQNFTDSTQKYSVFDRSKHNRHDSSNFGVNRVSSRNFRDEENSHERDHASTRKTRSEAMFTKTNFPYQDFHSFEKNETTVQQIEYLNAEVERLAQENQKLTDTLNEIQYNWSLHSNSDIDIIFKKRHIDEKFSHVLNEIVTELLRGSISVDEINKFLSAAKSKEIHESEPSDDCLFALDSFAETNENENVPVPIYDSFNEILESPSDSKDASPSRSRSGMRSARSCFNCGEDHHMGSCPHRLDFRKIALAKRRVKTNFLPSVRYHDHGKKERDFKPGVISDELREALNIKKDQIPPYVYRMRILDYPPGWLCEAAVESSGMVLYDSEGRALKEDNCEDGEVDSTGVRVQYDPDKLIDYPGFNVPLPPDMIDESGDHGMPPLQTHQLRCFVEKYMAKPDVRPSRKRKANVSDDRPSKVQRLEEDMEIEDSDGENGNSEDFQSEFVPPLPESTPPPPPPPPPPPVDSNDTSLDMVLSKLTPDLQDDNSASLVESAADHFKIKSCSDFSSGTSSPSLAELEELKKKLVMELGISADDNLSSEASQDVECNVTADLNEPKASDDLFIIDECVGSDDSNNLSNISDSSSKLNKTNDTPECSKRLERTTSQSKCVVLGTPSLSCHSPFVKLPDYEQFSKNVSSHIPFENLPNSTGTYEKLKGVLKTVKQKFNSLMK